MLKRPVIKIINDSKNCSQTNKLSFLSSKVDERTEAHEFGSSQKQVTQIHT
uniref:Uncharacterized protein n=1 Tax=Rhizophora mucronata TaxID=61149 RepID=A0A2P2PTF7_RHIMU